MRLIQLRLWDPSQLTYEAGEGVKTYDSEITKNLTVYAFLNVLEFSDRNMCLNDFYGNTHVLPSTEVGY